MGGSVGVGGWVGGSVKVGGLVGGSGWEVVLERAVRKTVDFRLFVCVLCFAVLLRAQPLLKLAVQRVGGAA